MLVKTHDLINILNKKYNAEINNINVIVFTFDYSFILLPGQSRMIKTKLVEDRAYVHIKTSFGIFHQDKIKYNDILVVLLEKVSGCLKEHQHDLIISALTYPNRKERRTIACGIQHTSMET